MDPDITTLCSDFYLNQKIALTMDVPTGRESVLDAIAADTKTKSP